MVGDIPLEEWFTPPDTLKVSLPAVELARKFLDRARQAGARENWVVTFDWGDTRRIRQKGTNNWDDIGPGIDLSAYERWKIQEKYIQKIEDMRVAMRIPRHAWEPCVQRLIDADEAAFSGLVLR